MSLATWFREIMHKEPVVAFSCVISAVGTSFQPHDDCRKQHSVWYQKQNLSYIYCPRLLCLHMAVRMSSEYYTFRSGLSMPLIGIPIRDYINSPTPKSPPSIKEVIKCAHQTFK